jgi:hypothetical protein
MKLPSSIQNMEKGPHGAGTSLTPFPPVLRWVADLEAQHATDECLITSTGTIVQLCRGGFWVGLPVGLPVGMELSRIGKTKLVQIGSVVRLPKHTLRGGIWLSHLHL